MGSTESDKDLKESIMTQLTCSICARVVVLHPGSCEVVDEFSLSRAALVEASIGPLAAYGFQAL